MKIKRKSHHAVTTSNKNINIITIHQPSALKRYVQRHQRVAPVRPFMGTFPVPPAPSYMSLLRPRETEGLSMPSDFQKPPKEPKKEPEKPTIPPIAPPTEVPTKPPTVPPTLPPTVPPTVPPTLPPTVPPTLPPPPPPPPPATPSSPVKVEPTVKKPEEEEPWWLKGLVYGGSALALTGLGLAGSEFARAGEYKYEPIGQEDIEMVEPQEPQEPQQVISDENLDVGVEAPEELKTDRGREAEAVLLEENKGTGSADDNKETAVVSRIGAALDAPPQFSAPQFSPIKSKLSSAVSFNKELETASPQRLQDLKKAYRTQVAERKGTFKQLLEKILGKGRVVKGTKLEELRGKFYKGEIQHGDLRSELNAIKGFEETGKFSARPTVPTIVKPPSAFVRR